MLCSYQGKIVLSYSPVGTTELVLYSEVQCTVSLIWRVLSPALLS